MSRRLTMTQRESLGELYGQLMAAQAIMIQIGNRYQRMMLINSLGEDFAEAYWEDIWELNSDAQLAIAKFQDRVTEIAQSPVPTLD